MRPGSRLIARSSPQFGVNLLQASSNSFLSESAFYRFLLAVLLLRLLLAAWMPVTSDEAYFFLWGNNPDYGFYDHTPMVGWWLTAFLSISDALWWLRLPAVVLPVAISWAIYCILKSRYPQFGIVAALSFLLAPVNIINVLVTTDTPLIAFSFLSVIFFYRAMSAEKLSYRDVFLSGLFLGLAFFSKYFAVILGLTYALYILFLQRNKKGLISLGLIFILVLPFAGLNLYWNYNHCGNNILFNVINRVTVPVNIGKGILLYLLMLIYLYSPIVIYALVRQGKRSWNSIKESEHATFIRFFSFLAVVPLFLFTLLLLKKVIGLHWIFSFYPFAFIALAGFLNIKQWKKTYYFMLGFSVVHVLIILVVLLFPLKLFSLNPAITKSIVFAKYHDQATRQLEPYHKDYAFATNSYALSAVASYYSDKYFMVFGEGSFHARQDDTITDYRKLAGKNILIFSPDGEGFKYIHRYFTSSEVKKIRIKSLEYSVLLGKGFKYSLYRDNILKNVNKKYYSVPDWLPVGRCEFKQKYGFK